MKAQGSETIRVLVDEPYSKINVEKFTKSQGKNVTIRTLEQEYELLIE